MKINQLGTGVARCSFISNDGDEIIAKSFKVDPIKLSTMKNLLADERIVDYPFHSAMDCFKIMKL